MSRTQDPLSDDRPLNPRDVRNKNRISTGLAIAALIIGIGACIAYGITTSILFNRTDQIPEMQNEILLAQLQILELAMQGTSNVTIIQNGTFKWTFEGSDLPTRSNYTIESVRVGTALDFTVFVLNPPLDVETCSPGFISQFTMEDFQPSVSIFAPLINAAGVYVLPLTIANVNRIKGIAPGCDINAAGCIFETSDLTDGYITGRNSIKITANVGDAAVTMNGYITSITTDIGGASFGLTSAWQLLMPVA